MASEGIRPLTDTPADSADFEQRLQRLEQVTQWLDTAYRIPVIGYPIGWDTILGFIPGVGDFATGALALWIIREARELGVSKMTLARMLANTGMDTVLGTVPLFGDLFDATFKSNVRNLKLLKSDLAGRKTSSGRT